MPDFYKTMKSSLRTVQEGADCINCMINCISHTAYTHSTCTLCYHYYTYHIRTLLFSFSCSSSLHSGLAVSPSVRLEDSGEFFRDRQIETKHFPLVGTKYTQHEVDELWQWCAESARLDVAEITNKL